MNTRHDTADQMDIRDPVDRTDEDRTDDELVARTAEESADQQWVDRTAEGPVDRTLDEPVDRTADQQWVDRTAEGPVDRTLDESVDRTADQQWVDRTAEQPVEPAAEWPRDPAMAQPMDRRADEPPATDLWDGNDAERMRARWHEIQLTFVDDPRAAAEQAETLVDEAAQQLTAALTARRTEVSTWRSDGDGEETERLRLAVQRYREVFDRLLAV